MTHDSRDEPYVGLAEVAEMAGVSKQTLCNWRKRGVRNVPKPIEDLAMGPVWKTEVIEKWLRRLDSNQRPPG